jgi:hypothetical protein
MKKEQDYIQDITEIRSMMERSSKFLSHSSWAGILAGIYSLTGAYIAWKLFHFNPAEVKPGYSPADVQHVYMLAGGILIIALITAFVLSFRKASHKGERVWNASSRRLLSSMLVPMAAGGILMLVFISKDMIGLLAPVSLLFYGIALYSAGKFTYKEVEIMGFIQMILGLIGAYFIEYGLLLWALGFGVVHIVYGVYMLFRYGQ